MKNQLSFLPPPTKTHGGELSIGKRKVKRPVAVRSPMHLVLKSHTTSLLKNEKSIRQILQKFSNYFFVQLLSVSVNSNHLHICLKAKSREGFHHFERAVAGTIALTLSSSKKGSALLTSFWKQTIYSRLVNWGRDLENTLLYILKNQQEAKGIIAYAPRRKKKKSSQRKKEPPRAHSMA